MPALEVRHFTTASGRDVIAEFLDQLPAKAAGPIMSHSEYARERSRREPRFQGELDAAAAELAIGELLVDRWHERNLAIADLAAITGIPGERLKAIEEGDSLAVHEVLWLLHALDLSITLDQDFHVTSRTPRPLRRSVG